MHMNINTTYIPTPPPEFGFEVDLLPVPDAARDPIFEPATDSAFDGPVDLEEPGLEPLAAAVLVFCV